MSKSTTKDSSGEWVKGVAFGVINGIMVTPVMISFTSIIFRDHAFLPYMPALIKLVLFSSLTHQLCFTLFSSLPFAVGQVQDAGLIFLSSMASSLVLSVSEENLLPTTLFLLCISTACLGVMLMLIGKLRLASVVQFLPMPVVGGYLAFIGFFCGQAGLAMMSGLEILSVGDWPKLCTEKALILILPGVVCGAGIYVVMMITRSPLSLPVCMVAILGIFFALLGLSGSSLQEARDFGWIAPLAEPLPFYEAWRYYDITAVEWSVFPSQVFRWVGMFLVVAFSSSLDIAAIEMELGLPMDYDRELMTVGFSNLFSGLLGGYTGSYIFSQTLFTMRSGINSRVCGYTIVICELLVLVIPISVTSFIPKFLFGSLLVFISVDLMHEWLVMSRKKMMIPEYIVCLFTFVAIQYVGIEVGMLMGILGAMANFVYSYAKKSNVTVTALRFSNAVRTFEERAILEGNRGKIVTISLEGFVFFGSAVKLLEEVKRHVVINTSPGEGIRGNDQDVSGDSDREGGSYNHAGEASPLLHSSLSTRASYTSPTGSGPQEDPLHYPLSPTKNADHGLPPVYDLTSDQIMAHHTKWKHTCEANTHGNHGSVKNGEGFTDVDAPENEDLGCFSSQALVSQRDDDEGVALLPISRKRIESEDYFLPPATETTESVSTPGITPPDSKAPSPQSVLLSIWESQGTYRQDRIKASAGTIKKVRSESNLQLQRDEYDQSSPKVEVSRKSAAISEERRGKGGSEDDQQATVVVPSVATEFMILNFTAVSGVDATAARSCFLMLVQLLRGAGATIVFAIPGDDSISLLKVHGVILDVDMVFSDLQDALEWCEEQVLFRHITARSKVQPYQSEHTNFAFSPRARPHPKNKSKQKRELARAESSVEGEDDFESRRLKEPTKSFDARYLATAWNDRHAPPSRGIQSSAHRALYQDNREHGLRTSVFVDNRDLLTPTSEGSTHKGVGFDPAPYRVLRRILLDYLEVDPDERCPAPVKAMLHSRVLARFFCRKLYTASSTVYHMNNAAETLYFIEHGMVELRIPAAFEDEGEGDAPPATSTRVSKISTGGVFGDASFFLSSTYTCSAVVTSEELVVWCLDKKFYSLLELEHPRLCILVQHVLLKSMSMAQASAIHSTHPSSCYSLFFK